MANGTDYLTDKEKLKPLPGKTFLGLISQEAKQKGHLRQQKIMDAVTSIVCWAIYIIPIILIGLYVLVLIHFSRTDQWERLEETLRTALVPVATYIVGLLSRNILNDKSE